MKRSLVLLGVLVLLVAAGCGGGGKKSSASTTTAGTAGSKVKIGLVTDIGDLNDRGFNHLSYVGLKSAESQLGIQQRVYQAKSTQEYVPNLSTFARQGYDLTIGVGFTEATAIDTVDNYSEDFSDQAKCKQIALNQIEQGAGVIFQVAGGCGLGALDAAKEKGVWGIGVDADQSFLGPHILTSAVKRVDTAVFDAIKLVADGKFEGGNIVFGLKDNGVGVGKISPKVPKSEIAKVMRIRADIIAGKIRNIPTTLK